MTLDVLRVLLAMFGLPIGAVAYGIGIVGLVDQYRQAKRNRNPSDLRLYIALCYGGALLVVASVIVLKVMS